MMVRMYFLCPFMVLRGQIFGSIKPEVVLCQTALDTSLDVFYYSQPPLVVGDSKKSWLELHDPGKTSCRPD